METGVGGWSLSRGQQARLELVYEDGNWVQVLVPLKRFF